MFGLLISKIEKISIQCYYLAMDIQIIQDKISLDELKKLAPKNYGDMIKAVIDIEQKILAIGGELHADAEALLLEQGSQQKDLWGFNIYPEKLKEEIIEYTSLINIRPHQENHSLEVESKEIRIKIAQILWTKIDGLD